MTEESKQSSAPLSLMELMRLLREAGPNSSITISNDERSLYVLVKASNKSGRLSITHCIPIKMIEASRGDLLGIELENCVRHLVADSKKLVKNDQQGQP